MSERLSGVLCVAIVAVVGALSAGCEAEAHEDTVSLSASVSIEFPSTETAASTDSIQLFAFDGTDAGDDTLDCQSLVLKRKTKQTLPTSVYDSGPMPVCALVQGTRGSFALSYGTHLVLVVAQRGDDDYLVGCARKIVQRPDPPTSIQLGLIDVTMPVFAPSCPSLSQKCGDGC